MKKRNTLSLDIFKRNTSASRADLHDVYQNKNRLLVAIETTLSKEITGNNRNIQIHSKNANGNEKPLRITPRVGRHVEQSTMVKAKFTSLEESVPDYEG